MPISDLKKQLPREGKKSSLRTSLLPETKPSLKTGERYLPAKAIKSLTSAEYARTTRKKREGMRQGKQFVGQPRSIRNKTRKFRRG
jgi:hypothetical protein